MPQVPAADTGQGPGGGCRPSAGSGGALSAASVRTIVTAAQSLLSVIAGAGKAEQRLR